MKVLQNIVNWAKGQFAEVDEAIKNHKEKSHKNGDIKSRIDDIHHAYEKKSDQAKAHVEEFKDNLKNEASQVSQEVKGKTQEKKENAKKDENIKETVESVRQVKDKANVKAEEALNSLTEDSDTKNNLSRFEATNTSGKTIVIEAENEAKVAQIALDKKHVRKKSSLTVNKLED